MTAFRCLAVLAGLLLLLGACAPTATVPTALPAATAGQLSYGTIVSVRPVTVSASGPGPRADIFGAIGMAGPGQNGDKAVEFIIREDGAAQPISVVQTGEDGLVPGQRVILTRGTRTRIARAGA